MSYSLRALDLKVARISNFSAWKVLNVLHRLIIKLHLICLISKMRDFLILYIAVLHLFKKTKKNKSMLIAAQSSDFLVYE